MYSDLVYIACSRKRTRSLVDQGIVKKQITGFLNLTSALEGQWN